MNDLFGDVEQRAIERIRAFEPPDGYWLADSGGKDSCVLLDLAKRAGVRFEAHFGVTTVDPPQVLAFLREHHPETTWDYPERGMFGLIPEKGFPTRRRRWCCAVFKEHGGDGRTVLTGIRWQESPRRAKRPMVHVCHINAAKRYVHPIIDWSTADVWQYIRERDLPYCSLYDEGYLRIGCVLCPMANPERDIARFPRFVRAYRRAFGVLWEGRMLCGEHPWAKKKGITSADQMFAWWLTRRGNNESDIEGQGDLFGDGDGAGND